ncbi:MAG: TetR/AcrR family transcriptional regulator [Acidimicrobiales bacterium]
MTLVDSDDALAARRADPRYQRLMKATRVAARNGYDAVSMRDLAETCRLSMTTIYQFCRSKDHLIAEAHLSNMEEFRKRISARPPRGATAEARVSSVMRSFAKALDDEALSRTLMRAMYSLDPEVGAAQSSVNGVYTSMLDAAIGDDAIGNREAVITTLGHVVDSVILGWLTRGHDTTWVRGELEAAVHVLFRGTATAGPTPAGPTTTRAKHAPVRRPGARRA